MGTAGGILMVASIVVFALKAESLWAILLYILGVAVVLALLVKFTLWRFRTGKGAKGLFLKEDQEGYTASSYAKEYIGKQGHAVTDLKPAGHIEIESKKYQAVSKTGYLVKGTKIEVVGGEGAHLIVKEVT